MHKGTVSFMAVQGFGQMIASFCADEDQTKRLFKKTNDKIICSGDEAEAYYCKNCHKMMPVIEV